MKCIPGQVKATYKAFMAAGPGAAALREELRCDLEDALLGLGKEIPLFS